jgi:hypothetical protein
MLQMETCPSIHHKIQGHNSSAPGRSVLVESTWSTRRDLNLSDKHQHLVLTTQRLRTGSTTQAPQRGKPGLDKGTTPRSV